MSTFTNHKIKICLVHQIINFSKLSYCKNAANSDMASSLFTSVPSDTKAMGVAILSHRMQYAIGRARSVGPAPPAKQHLLKQYSNLNIIVLTYARQGNNLHPCFIMNVKVSLFQKQSQCFKQLLPLQHCCACCDVYGKSHNQSAL